MDYKNLFLGANLAIVIKNEEEFNTLKEWMGTNNLFLANKEPVSKMSYPGPGAAIYRAPTGDCAIYWSTVKEVTATGYKVADFVAFSNDSKVVETEAVVIDEVTNFDIMSVADDIEVLKVKPAEIEGANIAELNKKVIPILNVYKNTIVTNENCEDMKKKCTAINKVVEVIGKKRKAVTEEIMKNAQFFIDGASTLEKAFKDAREPIWESCCKFDEEVKNSKKKELETTINQLKEVLIKNNMISKEYADKFIFDEKWLNKSTSPKAFKEAVEKQFNDLMEQEKKDKEVLGSIKSLIDSLEPVQGMMKPETYITLYQQGMLLGEVLAKITMEASEMTVKINESNKQAVEEAREDIVQETIKNVQQGVELVQENTQSVQEPMIDHFDEKTGELIGRSNDSNVIVKIAEDKNPDKIWEYTYQFSGNFRAIKTFNNFMKILSKINNTFKFEEKKG